MKILATVFLLSLATVSQAQFFKTLGFKTGITRSHFIWNYKPNSTATSSNDKSDKAIGMAFLLTADVIDNKHWGVNISAGWLQRNANVKYIRIFQGRTEYRVERYQTSYLTI